MEEKISQIKIEHLDKIQKADSLKELDTLFLALFGKSGQITELPKEFSKLSPEEKKVVGPLFNATKIELEKEIEKRREEVREESYAKLVDDKIDIAAPTEIKPRKGHLHPLTQFENEIVELFSKLYFTQYDAPHIDTDFNNFEVLNIPDSHPARDLWDTFYVSAEKESSAYSQKSSAYIESKAPDSKSKLLLRTHTSNGQIPVLKEFKTPIRKLLIGKCFRFENIDARHEHTFDQFELMYVDKGVNMTNLQFLAEYFLQGIYGKDIKVRLRPKYYPFVEPGAGIDGLCIFCKGDGCKICSNTGWLELAGAGMIHPQVLKNGGVDPKEYSGIAWGFGPLRMAMLKYGVEDMRLFSSGDLKFLKQF